MVNLLDQNRQPPDLPEPPKTRRQLDNKEVRAIVFEIIAFELEWYFGGSGLEEQIEKNGGSESDHAAAIRFIRQISEEMKRRADRARGDL